MTGEELCDVFCRNLKSIREEIGLTQSQLARRVGKFPSYICDLEKTRRPGLSIATIAELAEGLGVSPSSLLSTVRLEQELAGPAKKI